MATLTVEISEAMKASLDREVASGGCEGRDALVQSLLELGMHARWRVQMEAKIDEALLDVERGDVHPWTPGDAGRIGRKYFAEKRANERGA